MEKQYKLLIEMICPGCARGNCYDHILHQLAIDPKSDLEAEAVCVCKNHSQDN